MVIYGASAGMNDGLDAHLRELTYAAAGFGVGACCTMCVVLVVAALRRRQRRRRQTVVHPVDEFV